MLITAPLRQPKIAVLWAGQVLSCVGDEIHRVAAVWLATQLWGAKAGYLAALGAGTSFLFSLFGGIWADGWDRRATLVWSDVLRGLVVLAVPVGTLLGASVGAVLIPVVFALAALSTFFEPALRSSLTDLANGPQMLQATTMLLESTFRLGRLIGPSIVAVLAVSVPMIHFFTLDAVTYLASAVSIAFVGRALGRARQTGTGTPPVLTRMGVGALKGSEPLVRYAVISGAVAAAAWTPMLGVGMALLVRHRVPDQVEALATLIAAYGAGNLASNLLAGSIRVDRPERALFLGRVVAGLGFTALAFAPTHGTMMLSAALAATGGPLTDLGFMTVLQRRCDATEFTRIYRLHLALANAGLLALLLATPLLIESAGVVYTVAGCALVILGTGVYGIYRFRDPLALGAGLPTP